MNVWRIVLALVLIAALALGIAGDLKRMKQQQAQVALTPKTEAQAAVYDIEVNANDAYHNVLEAQAMLIDIAVASKDPKISSIAQKAHHILGKVDVDLQEIIRSKNRLKEAIDHLK
ncbi:MAG: hypothetical protein KatS3mg023_3671 [Armatimonadota bacterium]|nr:MAG: hypothetical protein KatS3mg023_3671 [Armatimonadota bacterium]